MAKNLTKEIENIYGIKKPSPAFIAQYKRAIRTMNVKITGKDMVIIRKNVKPVEFNPTNGLRPNYHRENRKLTHDVIKKILQLRKQGKSHQKIAYIIGKISRPSVQRICALNNA